MCDYCNDAGWLIGRDGALKRCPACNATPAPSAINPARFGRKPAPPVTDKTDLATKWRAFHNANPHVYREIERRALALYRGGARRIGVKSIIEDMRDEGFKTSGDEWQLNNSWTAFYSRELIARNPQLSAVIETRDSVADREVML